MLFLLTSVHDNDNINDNAYDIDDDDDDDNGHGIDDLKLTRSYNTISDERYSECHSAS